MSIIITNEGILPESEIFQNKDCVDRTVYEVIRIIEGNPLFLEDHFARLINSMQMEGLQLEMELKQFENRILELVQLNQNKFGNVRFEYSIGGRKNHWSFGFIPHNYPTSDDYRIGVSVSLLFAERENPNAKVVQHTVRELANRIIENQNLYEVLLVDRDGLITEGSRSNVFFVKGEAFYTAPASKVLVGITQQKVLECLDSLGFPVIIESVEASKINQFDAAFLTGTSPKVLPIRSIGNRVYSVQVDCVEKLILRYNQLIESYISKGKTQ